MTYAPSEYSTWAKLTEVYIDLEDYSSALLSLNSCPMFTYVEKDMHRMPPPSRTHLPLKQDMSMTKEEEIKVAPGSGSVYDENDPKENEVHITYFHFFRLNDLLSLCHLDSPRT